LRVREICPIAARALWQVAADVAKDGSLPVVFTVEPDIDPEKVNLLKGEKKAGKFCAEFDGKVKIGERKTS